MLTVCKICGIKFESKNENQKYCSVSCKHAGIKQNSLIEKTCKWCGSKFIEKKSNPKKFCKRECYLLWNKSPEKNKIVMTKIKATTLKRYGVAHTSKLPNVKAKNKETKLKRYGNENYVNPEKAKKTRLKKYGNENYVNVEKMKETKLKRYGDENYNNPEKSKKTFMKKYGVSHYTKTKEFRKIVSDTAKKYGFGTDNFNKNMIKKYGKLYNPKHTEKIKQLAIEGKIGFKSKKYKDYLKRNNISNVSQLDENKNKVKKSLFKNTYNNILNNYKDHVVPMFTLDEYTGGGYDILYKFRCVKCDTEFEHWVANGMIPRCSKCYPKYSSKGEAEIYEYLTNILGIKNIIKNDRKVLSPKELDIYIPDTRLAIEYDGLYRHSENGGKDKKYHLNKTEECEELNIKLLHIYETEWLNKQDIIKSIIKNKLGITDKKIYARKCTIKEIDSKTKNEFLNTHHLQGEDKSKVKLGLFYEDELVSVMTFTKSRFSNKYEYELSRYVNKINTVIIGGANKMFNYFIENYKPNSIVTYSDRRYFDGNVYTKLGFIFTGYTSPGYYYFDNSYVLENRINYQKHKLKDKLKTFDPNLTEWENMQLNGYDRIWDCGNYKYVWKVK